MGSVDNAFEKFCCEGDLAEGGGEGRAFRMTLELVCVTTGRSRHREGVSAMGTALGRRAEVSAEPKWKPGMWPDLPWSVSRRRQERSLCLRVESLRPGSGLE